MFYRNSTLFRFMLRRDRLSVIFWIVGMLLLTLGYGNALGGMYPTADDRLLMIETLKSPAMLAMIGPVYTAADGSVSVAMLFAMMMTLWSAMILAVMNIFMVVRHTRKDEELGRLEMIRSLPVGKQANISAVLSYSVVINLFIGLVIGFGLSALPSDSMSLAGSMAFGMILTVTGIFFAALAAVFCQLTGNPRTASSLSFAAMIVFFFIRAYGDMQGNTTISSISPLGLVLRTEPFLGNYIWPLLVVLGITILLAVIAIILCGKRDIGEGMFAARPGKADAAAYLKSPGALSWRLLRTPIIVWAFVNIGLGISYGSVLGDMETFIKSNAMFERISGGNPMVLISFIILVSGLVSCIPVIQFIQTAASQERRGYAESILARSVSRTQQLRGYFIIAFIAAILSPFLVAVGLYAAGSAVMTNPIAFSEFVEACMVYSPAIFMLLGLSVFLNGFFPKLTNITWAYLGYSFAMLFLGAYLGTPQWLNKISPFGWVPMIPADSIDTKVIVSLSIITAIGVVLSIAGFIGYKNRDMKFSA